jgi:2-(1,2-epoxy-1,2-dihydrophenyl)acetyl-CoA isomerase
MELPGLRLDITAGLARITLTQAERGNPIDGAFCASFCETAIQVSQNPAIRCVLITAEGKAFSYGGDVSSLVADLDSLPLNIKRWTAPLHSAIARLQYMNAPMVAAIHGVCAGGMSGIIAGCDIVLAADTARFVAAYAGIGFSCDAGTSVMYTRRMGVARTRKFLLLNETISAAEALTVGLVDEMVTGDRLLLRAEEVAKALAAGPTLAFGEMRRLLSAVVAHPLESQLELEAQALARVAASTDAKGALVAFSEKRRPVFEGR